VVSGGKKSYIFAQNLTANCLTTIVGTYECRLDNKGRLMLPAPLKKQWSGCLQDGFVLKRSVFQPCLELYPMAEWNVLMQKINKLNRFVKKNNDFIRRFTAGVKMVDMDETGRLLIARDLSSYAGMELPGDLVLASAVNILEIWDKNRYEAALNDTDIDFADLAEEVMGQQDDHGYDLP